MTSFRDLVNSTTSISTKHKIDEIRIYAGINKTVTVLKDFPDSIDFSSIFTKIETKDGMINRIEIYSEDNLFIYAR